MEHECKNCGCKKHDDGKIQNQTRGSLLDCLKMFFTIATNVATNVVSPVQEYPKHLTKKNLQKCFKKSQ
jgi:hypothetical protein